MSSSGYIYALINPSLPNCVKIGKTTRDVATRAAELSAATGVPTPFIVAYQAYFDDCDSAELFVHAHLESKGVRLAQNREFFSITPSDAINAILYAQSNMTDDITTYDTNEEKYLDDLLNELDESKVLNENFQSPPWLSTINEADIYLNGDEDTIENFQKAIELYKRAANLGSALAFIRIGEAYAIREKYKEGLDWIKRGAEKGHSRCWLELGLIYTASNLSFCSGIEENKDNAMKCFRRFFSDVGWRSISLHIDGQLNEFLITSLHAYLFGLNGKTTTKDSEVIEKFISEFSQHINHTERQQIAQLITRYMK